MLRLVLGLVLLSGCATLNTSGMTESCRRLYDACLNGCPDARSPAPGQLQEWRMDVASCTDDCNKQARKCQ